MSYENVYTDVIKDVIGNEPVLDQFDISYSATFYGGMQDDYITGSILSEVTSYSNNKSRQFVTGTRGRSFSKFYSDVQSSLDSTYGSIDVQKNSSLAFRQIPWSDKASRTYRVSQFFDSQERYYDSCLPDLTTCFNADGSSIWTFDDNPFLFLSPYGNVQTGSVGYLFFNSIGKDRTNEGLDNDPLVNNSWTWSYPYESRYQPLNRILKSGDVLGFTKVNLSTSWLNDPFQNITYSNNFRSIQGFFPLLMGYLEGENLAPNARNSLRSRVTYQGEVITSLFSSYPMSPAYNKNSKLDSYFGHSLLIPADVNLSQKVNHDYLNSYPVTNPGPEYLTGTMNVEDTVKFLFGFGDLNNLSYGYYTWDNTIESSSFKETFEYFSSSSPPSKAYLLGSSSINDYLTIDWSKSPSGAYSWNVCFQDGTTATIPEYNYLTGSTSSGMLMWLSSSSPSNACVLQSSEITPNESLGIPGISLACVDITSSYPWSFKYDRGVTSYNDDGLLVYFSGIPGIPTGELPLNPFQIVIPIDLLTGSQTGAGYSTGTMSSFNSLEDGISPYFPRNVPLDPGAYRLNFAYIKTGTTTGNPDFAAIDNLEIIQYNEESIKPDIDSPKYGANNYPKFRKVAVDTRYAPVFPGNSFGVTGTADFYSSYNFGISPEIRGWKYGIYSGLPSYSKSIFRRDRFGQPRDMLEQRQYTKFVNVNTSFTDENAVTKNDLYNMKSELEKSMSAVNVGASVVEVNFVKQRYNIDSRGIGIIYNQPVESYYTTSQNLSTEVTSSIPYFDGVARIRTEENIKSAIAPTISTVVLNTDNFTVT